MLLLNRKVDESVTIRVGNVEINVVVVAYDTKSYVKLGFSCDKSVKICRSELDFNSIKRRRIVRQERGLESKP